MYINNMYIECWQQHYR